MNKRVTIEIPEEVYRLLDRYGGLHGLDADDYATMALRRHLEDLHDIVVADAALKDLRTSGAKTMSWDEMMSVLDL